MFERVLNRIHRFVCFVVHLVLLVLLVPLISPILPVLSTGGSPAFNLFTFQKCSATQMTRKKSTTQKRKYRSKVRLSKMLLISARLLEGSSSCRITNSSVVQGWSISMKSSSINWTDSVECFGKQPFDEWVEMNDALRKNKLKWIAIFRYRGGSKRTRPTSAAEFVGFPCKSNSLVASLVRSQVPDCIWREKLRI